MRPVITIVMVTCVGCTSVHTSTLPPYVREVRVAPDRMEVTQCRITYRKETEYWSGFFGRGSETRREVTEGPCWRTEIATTVDDAGAPTPGTPGAP